MGTGTLPMHKFGKTGYPYTSYAQIW